MCHLRYLSHLLIFWLVTKYYFYRLIIMNLLEKIILRRFPRKACILIKDLKFYSKHMFFHKWIEFSYEWRKVFHFEESLYESSLEWYIPKRNQSLVQNTVRLPFLYYFVHFKIYESFFFISNKFKRLTSWMLVFT